MLFKYLCMMILVLTIICNCIYFKRVIEFLGTDRCRAFTDKRKGLLNEVNYTIKKIFKDRNFFGLLCSVIVFLILTPSFVICVIPYISSSLLLLSKRIWCLGYKDNYSE